MMMEPEDIPLAHADVTIYYDHHLANKYIWYAIPV
jgi:hypothetical protein